MVQHNKLRETHATCSSLMAGLCPGGDHAGFMKLMDTRANEITKQTKKLKEQLSTLNVLAAAAGGADAFPGFALGDHAPDTDNKLTFYVCLWTAIIYFTETETWSSTPAGQSKLTSLRAVVHAADQSPALLEVEAALQVEMFQQIRTELNMPFRPPVATHREPGVIAASGQQQTSVPAQAGTTEVPQGHEVPLAPAVATAAVTAPPSTASGVDATLVSAEAEDMALAIVACPSPAGAAAVGLRPEVATPTVALGGNEIEQVWAEVFGDVENVPPGLPHRG